MNKLIKDKIKELKLVAEDHWLKPKLQLSYTNTNDGSIAGTKRFQDYKNISDDIRLIGTEEQINNFWKENDFEIKDSWDSSVTEKHLNMYIENLNNLVVIGLI